MTEQKMSSAARILIFILSLSLLSIILYFSPPCPFLTKALSFLHHQPNNNNQVNYSIDFQFPSSTNIYYQDFNDFLHAYNPKDDSFLPVEASTATTWPAVEEKDVEPKVDEKDVEPKVDEKDVVVLTGKNFTEFVNANKFVMVNFYASWCYWSKVLAPDYAAAATMQQGQAVFAKVDASIEAELGRKFKVKMYPTMMFFVGGIDQMVVYDPEANRTSDAIANWVKLKMSPHVQTVTTAQEVGGILAARSTIVLAFLDSLEDPVVKELDTVSKLHFDVDFYQTTNADVAKLFHLCPHSKCPALVMLKRENGGNHTHFNFDGQFTTWDIYGFVSIYKRPSVIDFTEEDAPLIYNNPMKQLWLFTPKNSWKVESTFQKAAQALKGKLLFVHVNANCGVGRQVSHEFGVPDGALMIVAYKKNAKYIYGGELTLGSIKSFAEEFLEDKPLSNAFPLFKLPRHSHSFAKTIRPQAY